jgi:hypothetical protein
MTPAVLSPLAGLVACGAVHVAVARARPALPRHHGVLAGVLAGLVLVAGLAAALGGTTPDRPGTAAVWVLAYLSLAYFYAFGVFNPGESARRIRLLVELRAAGASGMSFEEILRAYSAGSIVDARLGRLLAAGEIVERGGRFVVGRSLLLPVARMLVVLKRVLYGARSESERGSPPPTVGRPARCRRQAAPPATASPAARGAPKKTHSANLNGRGS